MSPYIHLLRLHQPTGAWLLLWPCLWSLALAQRGMPPLDMILLFTAGAYMMRAAGCIINDMTDREYDRKVERTKSRPLASGAITMTQATALLVVLLILSLIVAYCLGERPLFWSLCAMPLVIAYPWMKRITWWPQLFLGLTFNWGAWVGWVALRPYIEIPTAFLYAGGIFWTLGYDTIYAYQDMRDDAQIGVKSLALRLGTNRRHMIRLFYLLAVLCWLAAGYTAPTNIFYDVGLLIVMCMLYRQVCSISPDKPETCLKAFKNNAYVGGVLWAACILGTAIQL